MRRNKITAIAIILGMLWINFLPLGACAVQEKKIEKGKIDYINFGWWQEYEDEYLEGYILKAVENNQDLKIATLRVEEARQATKLQLANEMPSLTVGASPLLYKMPGTTSTEGLFSVPIIANYEIDIFLKNHDKTKSSKKLYEVSQLNEKSAYISVAGAVGTAYYNIVKLDKLILLQEEIIKDRKQIYDLMKQSNEQGLVSTSDLVKADKSYIIATSDLIELIKAREVMLNTLAVLTGESPNNAKNFERISYDSLNIKKQIPAAISSEIITLRPDYLAAEKMVEKAKIDVRVAKKEFLPKIDIAGILGFTQGGGFSMNWTDALFGVGGAALLPLFTGGQRLANLRINKNKYEQILQNYYKTNLIAIQEVNDSLSVLKLDEGKYEKNVKALEMEQTDYKYNQMKYSEGVISYLDLLQRKETMLFTQKMVASNKIDCYVGQIGLYKATAAENL